MNDQMKELLIQRCVDGELSDSERASLLKKLDEAGSVEEWRTLALSFVENQVLAGIFNEPLPAPALKPEPAVKKPSRASWYRRQIHPLASVAAALCVGFVTGIVGHVEQQEEQPSAVSGSSDVATSTSNGSPARAIPVANRPATKFSQPVPVMNVNLTGLGHQSGDPVTVPVYSPEQWGSLPEAQTPVVIPEDVRRQLHEQGFALDHERQWYRAPLNDGREILVPTDTVRVRPNVQ